MLQTDVEAIEASVLAAHRRIVEDRPAAIWIDLLPEDTVRRAAERVAAAVQRGEHLPLAGRTLAVKGNIDVAGLRTTAGCPTYGVVAAESAPVVRRLEAAGAVLVGTTNLDQFATGLVGTRSPHGTPRNPGWPELVPGGSSSGSAVAVAAGLVDLALGTDTAGSGRVPAAANAIVGVKPTRGRLSTAGVVPACWSLDCVSVFARSVDLAVAATDLAAGLDPADPWSREVAMVSPPTRPPRLGIPRPQDLVLDGPVTASSWSAVVESLASALGAEVVEVDLGPFVAAGDLLYSGAFVAERFAAVGAFLSKEHDGVDPVVRGIIERAGMLPAWQLAADRTELERLRKVTVPTWSQVDALLVPTVPRVPTIAEVAADPVGVNTELGRYTNFVNLLDLCGVTVPAGTATADHPPPSITVLAPAGHDAIAASVARAASCY